MHSAPLQESTANSGVTSTTMNVIGTLAGSPSVSLQVCRGDIHQVAVR